MWTIHAVTYICDSVFYALNAHTWLCNSISRSFGILLMKMSVMTKTFLRTLLLPTETKKTFM